MFKKVILVIFIIVCFFGYYKINETNYKKTSEINNKIINHPDNLPNSQIARASSFGFQNAKADYYRIRTVNYIGSNAFHGDYKLFLYSILNLVTDLNPYFENPYIIGQLLLPSSNQRYEDFDNSQIETNVNQAILLGEKSIKNFCDPEKIKLIENEFDLNKIWTDEKYKNPCKSYKAPYYLAFTYYQYKNDPISAAKYYKIASAVENSIEGAKIMSAIMQGKGGEREKSYFMFLNLAKYIETNNEVCSIFGNEMEKIGYDVFLKDIPLTSYIIKNVELARINAFGKYEDLGYESDTKCQSYIYKATRELNLEFIERVNKNFKEETGENSYNAKQLYDKGYLDFLPNDYQQEEDGSIIYIFNEKTGNYDYYIGYY